MLIIFAKTASVSANPSANQSGPQTVLTPIWKGEFALDANVQYTFETSALVPATPNGVADTVLHVQGDNASNYAYLGGSDDAPGLGLGSRVVLTVPTARFVTVFVRAYNENVRGSATFTLKKAGQSQPVFSSGITFAGRLVAAGNLVAGTNIWTQEQYNGPYDSMILALSNATTAIAADDDDGLGLQSWLRLGAACPDCRIAYGRYNDGPEGPGFVAWDGDAVYSDLDQDGLGDSYEDFLTTDKNLPDTDFDGLDDAAEAVGLDGPAPVPLFKFGADPKSPDAFVEMDWVKCTGPLCIGGDDTYQILAGPANAVIAHFGPDIRLHIDNGVYQDPSLTT